MEQIGAGRSGALSISSLNEINVQCTLGGLRGGRDEYVIDQIM